MSAISFSAIDNYIQDVERSITETPQDITFPLKLGVDLGTAYIVLVVLDAKNKPVACNMQYAEVIRDGLVVDYVGACSIVKRLKEELEERLSVELTQAAIAVPPGTGNKDSNTHRYVVENAGLEVTHIVDEPTAANAVLNIKNGVVVDVGGGTTGLTIFENGKPVYTADEATGGTHFTYVIAGNRKITFNEAEILKKNPEYKKEIFPIVIPVIQKVSSIIRQHIASFSIDTIYLVGGTCCLDGFEEIVQNEIGITTLKPSNPFLVTPTGIAMNCNEIAYE